MLNGNPWACDFHFCAHEECRHKNAHAFPLPLPDAASIKKYLFIGTLKPTNQLYKWAGFEMTMIQLHYNDGSSQQSQKRERGWQQQPSAAGELLGTFCSGFYSYLKLFCYLGFICLFFRPKRAFAVCLSSTLLCAVAWTHRKMFHRQQPSTAPPPPRQAISWSTVQHLPTPLVSPRSVWPFLILYLETVCVSPWMGINASKSTEMELQGWRERGVLYGFTCELWMWWYGFFFGVLNEIRF